MRVLHVAASRAGLQNETHSVGEGSRRIDGQGRTYGPAPFQKRFGQRKIVNLLARKREKVWKQQCFVVIRSGIVIVDQDFILPMLVGGSASREISQIAPKLFSSQLLK